MKDSNQRTPNKPVSVAELSAQLGKLPPQATDLEEAVLGAAMLERSAIDIISWLKPEDFYLEGHQMIFTAIMELFSRNEPIDLLTVTQRLKTNGKLDVCGGAYRIAELTTKINSAANIEVHSRIIQEASIKRKLIEISSQVQRDAYEETTDAFELLDKADSELLKVSQMTSTKVINAGSIDILSKTIEAIDAAKRKRANNEVVGVPSGIMTLDRELGGFKPSDLIIVAARPGAGKTAFMLSIAKNCAGYFKDPVAIFSLEMSYQQLMNRLISSETGIPSNRLANGDIEDHELSSILSQTDKLAGMPMFIDDTAGLTILQIRARSRKLIREHGVKMIFVDYIQIAQGDVRKGGNREEEVGSIARGLKRMAKDLNVPVIALSQLSRKVEERSDKRPQLSDLRESGQLEQEADIVMFLYRPEYYEIKQMADGTPTAGMGEVIIDKFRNGSTGSVWLRFSGKTTTWSDMNSPLEITRVSHSEPPERPSINALPGTNTRLPYSDGDMAPW
jgi:replicative DNA helicase